MFFDVKAITLKKFEGFDRKTNRKIFLPDFTFRSDNKNSISSWY